MEEIKSICGRDVRIYINGKQLLQAAAAEVRQISQIHKIRSCFCNHDQAHLKGKNEYKAVFINMKFQQPFENCNFHDLDNFHTVLEFDNTRITLSNCLWNDFALTADKETFREHITLTALNMEVETLNERT